MMSLLDEDQDWCAGGRVTSGYAPRGAGAARIAGAAPLYRGGSIMNDPKRSRPLWAACALAILAASSAAHAASGGKQQSPTQPLQLLPDLAPTRLFFDRSCDLKGEIANKGGKAFNGKVNSYVTRNSQTISTHAHSLSLAPGAKVIIRLAPRPQLGNWVYEQAGWGWIVDEEKKVTESNDLNNSITFSGKCIQKTP